MRHLTEETVRRYVKGELPLEERNEAVRHLLARCPQCLRLARSAAAGAEGEKKKLDSILDRLEEKQKGITKRIQQERSLAAHQWASLKKRSRAHRLARIDANPQMHTWGLYHSILESARQTASKQPRRASEVAGLALAVAMSLDRGVYGEELIADYRAAAMAVRGNCKRIAKDFEGARADLEAAWKLLEMGTGDVLERAHVLRLGGAWNIDLGFLKKAEELLEKSINLYRLAADDSMVSRAMISQALAIGYHDPEMAISVLKEASGYINPIQEPKLELCLRHNLAWCLNDAGRPMEALGVLRDSRRLYRRFRDPKIQFPMHWLEGRINQSLGNLNEAEEILARTATDCLERGLLQEYLFCSLDLATAAYARGDRKSALQICNNLYHLLELWHMHTEKMAVLLFITSFK